MAAVGCESTGRDASPTDRDGPTENDATRWSINCGGGSFTAADGTTYRADTEFSAGRSFDIGQEITGTEDQGLYQTVRWGRDFSYSVPVDPGTYRIDFKFAEAAKQAPDQRVFNVKMEGHEYLVGMDIFAVEGRYAARDETFTITVDDGELDIDFEGVVSNAQVAAIRIESTSDPVRTDLATMQVSPQISEIGQSGRDRTFNAFPASMGEIIEYEWDFGDGETSTEAAPLHAYEHPGAYEVTLNGVVTFPDITLEDARSFTLTKVVHELDTRWNWNPGYKEYSVEFDESWQGGERLTNRNNAAGGKATVTLTGTPKGLYDLKFYMKHDADGDPMPRFKLDGDVVDLVPTDGSKGFRSAVVKTIMITDHTYTFEIEDMPDGGMDITHISIEEKSGLPNAEVTLNASDIKGELPLEVDFTVDGEISDVKWNFGDGAISYQEQPLHVFSKMGRFNATLQYKDANGISGIASIPITIKPSKVDLPGLTDVTRFGFYSGGFSNLSNYHQQDGASYLHNHLRLEELQALNTNIVTPGGYPWQDGPGYQAFRDDLAEFDIEMGIARLSIPAAWYMGKVEDWPREEWIWDPSMAQARVDQIFEAGVDISAAGWMNIGHEIGEYAPSSDIVKMHDWVRERFPNLPTMAYYGGLHALSVEPGTADINQISARGPFITDENNERQFDPSVTLNAVLNDKQFTDQTVPNALFWVSTNLPGEKATHTVDMMWSPEELLDYARILLSVGGIDAILFRPYGRFQNFDISMGARNEPEDGFVEQREAVRTIGGWVKQTQAQRPILIIRSPEMKTTVEGNALDVSYAIIGENTELVDHVVLKLDDGSLLDDGDLDGDFRFDSVDAGKHDLTAYLAAADGTMIEGSEVRVLSVTTDP